MHRWFEAVNLRVAHVFFKCATEDDQAIPLIAPLAPVVSPGGRTDHAVVDGHSRADSYCVRTLYAAMGAARNQHSVDL
jgi:hypothetical protein